jgi:phenolic acid decarboxylase
MILLHQIKKELYKQDTQKISINGFIDVKYMTEFSLENTDIIDPYGELTLFIRCVNMCLYMYSYACF